MIRTNAGSSILIEPRVHYSGKPTFAWSKDNGPLPSNIQVYDHKLIVPSVTRENQGVYTLTLNDHYGTAKIQISVLVDETATTTRDPKLPKKFIVRESTDIELEAGQNANIICKLRPKSYKAISMTSWLKGHIDQQEKFPSNMRSNQELLQIIRVKPSDAGAYTCTLSSSDGTHQNIVINLRVRGKHKRLILLSLCFWQNVAFN